MTMVLRQRVESQSLVPRREIYSAHAKLSSLLQTRNRPLVFLRMFFFPSGKRVDKHVLQGGWSGDAVKHSICGRLEEVPVPRKINSYFIRIPSSSGILISRLKVSAVAEG